MLDFTKEIVPFKSLGGIALSSNINERLSELYKNHRVDINEYNHRNVKMLSYVIDNSIIINTLESGIVISVIANQNYEGRYLEFHTGMIFKDIKRIAKELNVLNGCLIIDKNYGMAFVLPSPYDEVADYPSHLPDDLVLNEIFLSDFTWWYKPELTPDYAK